jgi:retron-type reverse transcriptase
VATLSKGAKMIADKITSELRLIPGYVSRVARSASYRYKTYDIPKKRDPTAKRTINHPARELKLLQRWIVKNVVALLPVHRAAVAYKKHASIAKNARLHRRNNYLLKIDFRDFFPSLTGSDVIHVLRRNSSALTGVASGPSDFDLIRKLVCKGDRLTIGAPSSPALSNAIMFSFDTMWHDRCKEVGVTFSRYADDVYFSTNHRDVLAPLLEELREKLKHQKYPTLTINDQKTVFTSRKRKKIVTGLVVTPEGSLSLGRQKIRHLRSLVFRSIQGGLPPEQANYLRGMLAYARSVEPELIDRLRQKFHKKFGLDAIAPLLSA